MWPTFTSLGQISDPWSTLAPDLCLFSTWKADCLHPIRAFLPRFEGSLDDFNHHSFAMLSLLKARVTMGTLPKKILGPKDLFVRHTFFGGPFVGGTHVGS